MYFKEFIDFCQMSRNLSQKTVEHYADVLSIWSLYCAEHAVCPEDVTSFDVIEFMTEKRKAGCRASTINQYLVVVRSYYRFLVRFHFDLCNSNPVEDVEKMKEEKTLPVSLPKSLLDKVAETLSEGTFKQIRSKAIFLCLYHCGLRRSEVCALEQTSVDLTSRTLRVYGKGRKVRLVPMSKSLTEAMAAYVSAAAVIPWREAFFVQQDGQRLQPHHVNYIVRQILVRFVSPKLAHPHILRHSFATICIEAGVSIENLAALMGHESVTTTMRYLSLSPSRLFQQIANVF